MVVRGQPMDSQFLYPPCGISLKPFELQNMSLEKIEETQTYI